MRHIPLIFPFVLALAAFFFNSAFLPQLPLLAFSPLLAIAYQRYRLVTCLWIATLCGLLIDLCGSQFRFGLTVFNFILTTLIAYRQRHHFYEDKPLALASYVVLISFVSTLLQLPLLMLPSSHFSLNLPFFFTDFLLMPIVDGLYAFFWFTCPLKLYNRLYG